MSTNSLPNKQALALLDEYKSTNNQELLGKLYAPHMEMVFVIGLKYFKDPNKADDVVMRVYEKLVSKAHTQQVSNFSSWLYTVAKNECLMQLRKKKEILVNDFSFRESVMESEQIMHLFNTDDNQNQMNALSSCLEQLKEDQQICIKQFYLENKTYKEIAEDLNFTLKEIKSYIQNGKRNLKNCIEKNDK